MSLFADRTLDPLEAVRLAGRAPAEPARAVAERAACYHCGEPCPDHRFAKEERLFCCRGCLTVHELLAESGLGQFYELSRHPGVRIRETDRGERYAYLDEPALRQKLLDFSDARQSRVTFHIPSIHCVACVWLLENLFRLNPGVGHSQVNFLRRELSVSFAPDKLRLSELVALLASLGYEPLLTLGESDGRKAPPGRRRQWLQTGIAGFAFGNIMLLSLPGYLGLDGWSGPLLRSLFGYLSLALAAPVLVYSASDYWRAGFLAMRQRVLTLDVPIALGLAALYAQSAFEILSRRGDGYLDSLAGLVFLLLCGRAFQQKTHARLAFDRDYKCFFPLSVLRQTAQGEETVSLSSLRVGDRLVLRNGELLPADATLSLGPACIDYSFVTGESEPVTRKPGDYLYAGGRQMGGTIQIETVKPVSQSYLTSLWNHETFQKNREQNLNTLTNRYSRRFTAVVIGVAVASALFWAFWGQGARGLKAFTSVLIVACPCALALAAPFALGTAQRWLAHLGVFLKNALVLERMADVDFIVFDKTGTLTAAQVNEATFHPAVAGAGKTSLAPSPSPVLGPLETSWIRALAKASTHPHAGRIRQWLAAATNKTTEQSLPESGPAEPEYGVEHFEEVPGRGISGGVAGHLLHLGSEAWLKSAGITCPPMPPGVGSGSALAIDGKFRGWFAFENVLRPDTRQLLAELGKYYELALLSGDHSAERERFRALFGDRARLHFNQSPLDKLGFIRGLQEAGKTVMMVGDGLNDAGALKQSDVGVAVIETVGAFSPASDVIMEAGRVAALFRFMALAKRAVQVVRWSFGISAAYNIAGLSIASAGILSPLICAVLMPVSSLSVILFACGAVSWAARTTGLLREPQGSFHTDP